MRRHRPVPRLPARVRRRAVCSRVVLAGSVLVLVVTALVVRFPGWRPVEGAVVLRDPSVASSPPDPVPRDGPVRSGDPLPSAARTVLPAIPVREASAARDYDRSVFGQAWSDDVSVEGGHDGCDTRNDILRRDLREVRLKPGTRGCVVLSGVLDDPYSGAQITFVRQGGASTVQIDHVVALADAWRTGAADLSPERRRDLANDPLGLLAVSSVANAAKSDADASSWLPPEAPARCGYVARQVLVKHRYGLWMNPGERAAVERELAGCP